MKPIRVAFIVLIGLLVVFSAARAADATDGKKPEAKTSKAATPFKNVNVAQFDKLRGDSHAVVLDVRTEKEFASGHIPGAVNIDVNSPDFDQKVSKLDKSKTYLVHCAAGVRSVKACNKLAPLEFEHLYNLEGGFNAWKEADKPVEKK